MSHPYLLAAVAFVGVLGAGFLALVVIFYKIGEDMAREHARGNYGIPKDYRAPEGDDTRALLTSL